MSTLDLLSPAIADSEQAALCLQNGQYHAAAMLYEHLVDSDSENMTYRWHLGLAYLLQGEEAEAQMTWSFTLMSGDAEQVEQWTAELQRILQQAAQQQQQQNHLQIAWVIRQHLRELIPNDIINLFTSLQLALELDHSPDDELQISGLIEALQGDRDLVASSSELSSPDSVSAYLLAGVESILAQGIPSPGILAVTKACVPHIEDSAALIDVLLGKVYYFGLVKQTHLFACLLGEIILSIDHQHTRTIRALLNFYAFTPEHKRLLELARQYHQQCQTPLEKILGNNGLLRALFLDGNSWDELLSLGEQQMTSISNWLNDSEPKIDLTIDWSLLRSAFYSFLFLGDRPDHVRPLQNRVMQRCHQHLEAQFERDRGQGALRQAFTPRPPQQRRLKVGYVSYYMRQHSVGWLARWLFQNHDCDRFEISTYHLNHTQADLFMQRWYVDPVSRSLCLHGNASDIAEALYQDDLDILVDLDSITFDITCDAMLYKPAPIQVSWLGLDAPGSPTIDYYMADAYVIPESAQSYYAEEIWRLPHSYIAVDGFEIDVPTLRRDDLGISEDAVIYLSAQSSHKRYPNTIRLQLQIIKAVPNSVFLIKGLGSETGLQQLFLTLAAEVGVEGDRLKFLPRDPSEAIHRANLRIADVVLDTFPYNGATTTLETLWMGIPMVTRVGEQFAARNSYTMMVNAGIKEGIAWTDEEYVAWGVRLGMDETLRQQIAWKLGRSRQTAPLWNTKQFARDMEQAYEGMWQRYISSFLGVRQ